MKQPESVEVARPGTCAICLELVDQVGYRLAGRVLVHDTCIVSSRIPSRTRRA